MTVQRTPLGRSARSKVLISLDALQFQANMHGAVADQGDPLVNVCSRGHQPTRVRQTIACPECGNADKDTWQKAQESGDILTVLDDADMAAIMANDATFKKEIKLSVVEANSADLPQTGSSYFLAPAGVGAGGNYTLIAELIKKRPKFAFIGEFSFLAAPHLYRLVVDDGVLVLRELARPEAVRERPEVPVGKVDGRTLNMATQIVDALAKPFVPDEWVNAHARDVADLVAKTPVTAQSKAANGGDLLAQLEASLAALTAAKAPAAKAPARKRAAKKPATADLKIAS